jgi:hypothetical protein
MTFFHEVTKHTKAHDVCLAPVGSGGFVALRAFVMKSGR